MSDNILDQLRESFPPEDLEWRIQQSGITAKGTPWARIVAYVTNRAIQDRLDDVVGPDRWRNEYAAGPQGGVLCGISLYLPTPDQASWHWVTKWDGAENTDIEGVKGGLSGSMKRAAVQWGIGRFLYDIGESWAEFVADRTPGSHMVEIKDKDGGKKRYWWTAPTPKGAK